MFARGSSDFESVFFYVESVRTSINLTELENIFEPNYFFIGELRFHSNAVVVIQSLAGSTASTFLLILTCYFMYMSVSSSQDVKYSVYR